MVSEESLGEGAVLVATQTKDSDAWREGQRAARASEAAGSMQRPDALLRILHRGCGTASASRRRRSSADVVAYGAWSVLRPWVFCSHSGSGRCWGRLSRTRAHEV
jgi:hypothetical protein